MEINITENITNVTLSVSGNGEDITLKVTETPQQVTLTVSEVGQKGDKGENGLSAYQVALGNGFIGTEEQWLESLKGQFDYRQETFENANGIILDFNLQTTPLTNKESVYLNGQKLSRTKDYNINSNIITFMIAPISGDIIDIEYFY